MVGCFCPEANANDGVTRPGVGGHDNDRVFKGNRPPLGVGQAPVV